MNRRYVASAPRSLYTSGKKVSLGQFTLAPPEKKIVHAWMTVFNREFYKLRVQHPLFCTPSCLCDQNHPFNTGSLPFCNFFLQSVHDLWKFVAILTGVRSSWDGGILLCVDNHYIVPFLVTDILEIPWKMNIKREKITKKNASYKMPRRSLCNDEHEFAWSRTPCEQSLLSSKQKKGSATIAGWIT